MSEPSSRRVWGQRPGQPYNGHMRLFSCAFFFLYICIFKNGENTDSYGKVFIHERNIYTNNV